MQLGIFFAPQNESSRRSSLDSGRSAGIYGWGEIRQCIQIAKWRLTGRLYNGRLLQLVCAARSAERRKREWGDIKLSCINGYQGNPRGLEFCKLSSEDGGHGWRLWVLFGCPSWRRRGLCWSCRRSGVGVGRLFSEVGG